jgi:hypothetical protein
MILLSRLAVLTALAATALSQTFVVDASNGPGTDYTDLPSAIAAVPDGATLVVRAGSYSAAYVSLKGLTILGEPGARIDDPGVDDTLTVFALLPTQRFVVRGLDIQDGGIWLSGCSGTVHVEDCHSVYRSNLNIQSCAQVSVVGCSWIHYTGGVASGSNVVCVDTAFASYGLFQGGFWVSGGSLQLVRCNVTGGVSGPGIQASSASVRLLGPGTVASGSPMRPFVEGAVVVRVGANVATTGAPLYPGTTVVTIDEGTTSATVAALGGTVTGTLEGSPNLLGGLMLGTTLPPVTIPGIAEELWLNPFGFLAVGVLGVPLTFAATIPNDPLLRGAIFGWQGMTWQATGGFVLSNPAWFCVQ